MKLKYKFVFQPVGDVYVATAVGDDARQFNGMVQLNATGYRIMQLIGEGADHDKIIETMLNEYDVDRDTLVSSVDRIIDSLVQEGVVVC